MKSVSVTALFLVLLASSSSLTAAPGKPTATGPFGVLNLGVRDLVFPAADPGRMLLKTRSHLFESRDGGTTWRSVVDNHPQVKAAQLVADPVDPHRWYAVGNGFGARIWQTADAGRSWNVLPWPAEDSNDSREMQLFVDAREPRRMVLEITSPTLGGSYRYLSQDRGASFSPINQDWSHNEKLIRGVHDGSLYTTGRRFDLTTGQAFTLPSRLETAIFFDRRDSDTYYYFVNETLHKSSDRGATYESIEYFGPVPRVFAQSPRNPEHLAVVSSMGLYLSRDDGATWMHYPIEDLYGAAFDPATGELLLVSDQVVRQRLDGSFGAPSPLVGLPASDIVEISVLGERAIAVSRTGATFFRDDEGIWERRGDVDDPLDNWYTCQDDAQAELSAQDTAIVTVVCGTGTFTSTDAGWTWKRSPIGPTCHFGPCRLLASGNTQYFLDYTGVRRSLDFGFTWELLEEFGIFRALAASPEHGLLALHRDGRLYRHSAENGWQPTGVTLPGNVTNVHYQPFMAHASAHPNLIYGIRGSLLSRSLDFGATWEVVSDLDQPQTYLGPYNWRTLLAPSYLEIAIDPFDANHFLLPAQGLETRDGGRTFSALTTFAGGIAAFDPHTPGRLLMVNDAENGVLEKTASLPECTTSNQAWCAQNGRFLLTVDWKDPFGNQGRAAQVATGSEDSGLFYFFDPNNWELLVKVLDGCGVNQRYWLFAAGTTDVEYQLRVEDRWTGQIRYYYNPAGQAAPAITDTDAFAGCGVAPPPDATSSASPRDARAGETSLLLVNGRFEVKSRWTDFAGAQGDARTAPLSSANSGIFYFFSPDNWEMLVKVLDGCAINNHYWVLAAATTNVGYELTVRSTTGNAEKTYRNPVGRAAPATIDLEAFTCP